MSEGSGSDASSTPDGKKLRRPVEEVRAELLADPDVRQQAKMLKIPLAEYVEKIIDYALHPQKPAQLQILSDEELKAKDPKAPTVAELQDYLQKIIDGEVVVSPAHMPDGFGQDSKAPQYQSMLGTGDAQKGPPEVSTTTSRPPKSEDPKKN